jgi:hypothetical protein
MDATCTSEMSDDFQRTTRRYIPRDRTLQHFCVFSSSAYHSALRNVGKPAAESPGINRVEGFRPHRAHLPSCCLYILNSVSSVTFITKATRYRCVVLLPPHKFVCTGIANFTKLKCTNCGMTSSGTTFILDFVKIRPPGQISLPCTLCNERVAGQSA